MRVEAADQEVDVAAPPVSAGHRPAAAEIALIARLVGEIDELVLLGTLLVLAVGLRFAIELVIRPEDLFTIRESGGAP